MVVFALMFLGFVVVNFSKEAARRKPAFADYCAHEKKQLLEILNVPRFSGELFKINVAVRLI